MSKRKRRVLPVTLVGTTRLMTRDRSRSCLVVDVSYTCSRQKGGERRMRVLPTFLGYTVDVRLKEFRKAVWGEELEFIPFDSPKGEHLFSAWLRRPGALEEIRRYW